MLKKKTTILALATFIGFALLGGTSHAVVPASDPVPVDLMTYMGQGLNEQVYVKIGDYSVSVYAGFYNLDLIVSEPGQQIWTGDYSGYGFCGEDRSISTGSYSGYSLYEISAGSSVLGAVYLMENLLEEVDTAHEAASLQVAIWESILDSGNGYNLGEGNFQVLSSTWDRNQSLVWLADLAVADLSSIDTASYRFVSDDGIETSAGTQDFIVKNNLVPVPGTVWLFGPGLAGLLWFGRKTGFAVM